MRARQKLQQAPRWLDSDEVKRIRQTLRDRDQRMRAERLSHNLWRSERGRRLLPDYGRFSDHLEPMCLLVLNTGIRPGRELFELRWSDVNLRKRQLTVTADVSKTGIARTIPLNAEAVSTLRAWRKPRDEFVFSNKGKPFTDIKKSFKAVCTAAGLKDCTPYTLRHTFGTQLVMSAGVPLPTAQKLLGHSDIKTTLIYVHVTEQDTADAVAKLVS